ncbi:PadR family transcriptional regulator [Paraburkholderia eburnea]|uniref:PadR family transcriptional regulator n=1 Tax=Paraburkholderia eburnea TaxID=1189126 RepID=A0A2S4MJV9_9BURK|nr:PadR family transcriptional regulator [Paraburkholderia eburnea]POR54951.1 PadR family transcriptional regulator [Paraburkholderia eburnea]PRZ24450.1 PadR family transcriptional regulator [Paraburkholderia eburnea]
MRHPHHSGHHGHHRHGARAARDFFETFGHGDFAGARLSMLHPLHALHALRHAMGRRGGEGPGDFGDRFGDGFGRGFGGPGGFGDGDGFGRGRKFSSEDLQLMLLALLAERPSHGYELIKALESRSNGFYSPSPGMVYPALTYLEELGYVSVTLEGNRKRYQLSEEGRAHLGANRERADLILAKLTHFGRKMDLMRRAFAGEDPADGSGWVRELIEARRAFKHALLRRTDASPEEQRRIAAIIVRATQEIENGGENTRTDDSAAPGA